MPQSNEICFDRESSSDSEQSNDSFNSSEEDDSPLQLAPKQLL